MATIFTPALGGEISDLDSVTPADRLLDTAWDSRFRTGYLIAHNASDATAYVVTADDELASGRGIPAGATIVLGPYGRSTELWAYGTGAGSLYYSFDLVFSEG